MNRLRECCGARTLVLVVSTAGLTVTPLHAQSARMQVTATVAEVTELHEVPGGLGGLRRAAIAGPNRQWWIRAGRGVEIGVVVNRVLGALDGPSRVTVCTLRGAANWDCQLATTPSRHLCGPRQALLVSLRLASPRVSESERVAGLELTIAYTAN